SGEQVTISRAALGHAIAIAREDADRVRAVPLRAGARDPAQLIEDLCRRNDFGEEAEVRARVEVSDPVSLDVDLGGELVTAILQEPPAAVVVVGHRGELVDARHAATAPFSKRARTVAVLLDELDLHRTRLRQSHLDVDRGRRSPERPCLFDRGEDVERPDAEDGRPTRGGVEQIVDDEAELEEAVVALRPGLLEQGMRRPALLLPFGHLANVRPIWIKDPTTKEGPCCRARRSSSPAPQGGLRPGWRRCWRPTTTCGASPASAIPRLANESRGSG